MSNAKLYNEARTGFVYIENVLGINVLHEGYTQRVSGNYANLDKLRVVAILTDGQEFTLAKAHVEFSERDGVLATWAEKLDKLRGLAKLKANPKYPFSPGMWPVEVRNDEATGVPDEQA